MWAVQLLAPSFILRVFDDLDDAVSFMDYMIGHGVLSVAWRMDGTWQRSSG